MTARGRVDRVLAVAASLAIATYFWRLVRTSLHLYFSPDDMMNLYRAWDAPVHKLVEANFLFFLSSRFMRPLAEAWYRAIYHFAGFNPAPFHAALLAILCFNIYLTYALARRLSGSRETGAVAALLGCYHGRMGGLYFDTGFIYDVLCYCFYFSALLLYLRARQRDRLPRGWEMAAVWVLYACALSSKEIAVTFPLFLLAYELLYHGDKWRAAHLPALLFRQGRAILLTGVTAVVFIAGRSIGGDTVLTNPAYRPAFTWGQFLLTSRHFPGDLLDIGDRFQTVWLLLLWVALFAVAWALRSRALKFAWLFLMLSPLPVAFLSPRGAPQYYVPWFGWVLYAATLLVETAAWLTRRAWPGGLRLARTRAGALLVVLKFRVRADGFWLPRIRGSALLLLLMFVLYPHFKRQGLQAVPSETEEAARNRLIVEQLHRLAPTLPRGARLFFLHDPVADDYQLMFMVRLSYRDNSLIVDRARLMKQPPTPAQLAAYTHVFDYAGGRFFELTSPWRRPPMPMVSLNPLGPEFFHLDWTPVSRQSPARAGEEVIAKAVDLGETVPPVPAGREFPQDPLLPVAAPVEVLVAGRPAQVKLQIGWPHAVNTYRVDFLVPDGIAAGIASVSITARHFTGPAVELPVR